MDRYLKKDVRIKNPDRSGEYEIRDIIGTGASCVVYLADFHESAEVRTEHLLKEYNPKGIRIERDDHGILRVSEEKDHAAFEAGLQRFEAGYRMQLNVRRCSDMKNSTSNIQSIFETNGTRYIDMTVMEGKTYNQVQEDSLYDLLRRIKTITEVIADYHKNGLLHLDIKPENILALPETVEMVQMFDYDSVTSKKDVIHSAFLSYTQSWAAQEQILPNRRNRICEATDLFAIGEILFYKLMGRHSESHERRSFSSYWFDYSANIFEGVNPRVFGLLEDILRHTICNKCADRYQTASELLEKLTDAIELADPRKPFLQHHLPSKSAYFIGRDAQLQEIADRLKHTDKLFISGMGGMGKSELVKQYAHSYQDAYDAVIFAVCNTDLESMILDDSMLPIGNVQQWPDEKAQEYYTRKLNELKKLCNKRILIIVDNFNDLQDEALNALLRLNCKMLFTTRCDVTEYNYEQMELGTMAEEYVWDIFRTWYGRQPVDEERMYARQIIDLYLGHTMAVELIAKQMKASHISPKQMLDKLGTGGFRIGGRERVIHAKDGMHPKLNIHDHIRRLFDVSELNDEQIYILANLSLMPPSGVSAEMFHDWCQLDGYEDINELAESGWLRQDPDADLISLHPVIADVMLGNASKIITCSNSLLYSFTHSISDASFSEVDAKKRNNLFELATHICRKLPLTNSQQIDFICASAYAFSGYGAIDLFVLLLKQALELHELSVDNNISQEANIYFVLGHLFSELSDYVSAKEMYTASLNRYLQAYGKNSTFTADAYNCIGISCSDLTQFEDAEQYYLTAMDIWRGLYGETSSDVADAYNNLGLLYSKLGYYEKAEQHYLKAIHIRQQLHDDHHRDTPVTYCNLACLYNDQGIWEKAEEFHKYALRIRIALYGYRHHDTATSYNNLGSLYSDMGMWEKAEDCFLKALDIMESIYRTGHSRIAATYCNLGLMYRDAQMYAKAETFLLKTIEAETEIHGNTCCEVADTQFILGSMYYDLSDFVKAEQCYLSALSIQRTVLSEMHIDTAVTCNRLGMLYHDWGEYTKSEKYYKRAIHIKLSVCEKKDPSIAASIRNLGYLYCEVNRLKSALNCFKRALQIYLVAYEKTNSRIISLYHDIGTLYHDLGNIEKARKNLRIAYKLSTRANGREHETTTQIRKEFLKICE